MLDNYSTANLEKIQEHLEVFYFTKRILEQDLTRKYRRESVTDASMQIFLKLVPDTIRFNDLNFI